MPDWKIAKYGSKLVVRFDSTHDRKTMIGNQINNNKHRKPQRGARKQPGQRFPETKSSGLPGNEYRRGQKQHFQMRTYGKRGEHGHNSGQKTAPAGSAIWVHESMVRLLGRYCKNRYESKQCKACHYVIASAVCCKREAL